MTLNRRLYLMEFFNDKCVYYRNLITDMINLPLKFRIRNHHGNYSNQQKCRKNKISSDPMGTPCFVKQGKNWS